MPTSVISKPTVLKDEDIATTEAQVDDNRAAKASKLAAMKDASNRRKAVNNAKMRVMRRFRGLPNDSYTEMNERESCFKNLTKIKQISYFEDDWNGYGARRFSLTEITCFALVISDLKTQPEISPTGRNSLYMRYKTDDKSELSFEMFEDKLFEVYVPHADFSLATENTYYDNFADKINESVKKLYDSK